MPGVDWQEALEREINALAAVVVLWTPASVASRNVRDEARLGKHMEKLVNVLAGVASPPFPYDAINGLPLDGWSDRAPHSGWTRLVTTIEGHLVKAGGVRPGELTAALASREAAVAAAERAQADAEAAYQQAQARHDEAEAAQAAAAAAFARAETQLASVVGMNASPALLHAAHGELERAEQARDGAERERRAASEGLTGAARQLTAARAALGRLVESAATAPRPQALHPPSPLEPTSPASGPPDRIEADEARTAPPPAQDARAPEGTVWRPRERPPAPTVAWSRPLALSGVAAVVLFLGLAAGLLMQRSAAPPADAAAPAALPVAAASSPALAANAAPPPAMATSSPPPAPTHLTAADKTPTPAPEAAPQADPYWLRKPSGDDVAKYYPDRASRLGLSGKVMLQCGVANSGWLQACTVVEEDPPDQAFGDAAQKLSKLFRMKPGSIPDGATVKVPIAFQVPKDESP